MQQEIVPSQTYWAIVARQYRKNPISMIALWVMIFLFLIAIFAPAIASDKPFLFNDGSGWISPWLHELVRPNMFDLNEVVDYIFNIVLVIFFPWLLISQVVLRTKGQRWGLEQRAKFSAGLFLIMLVSVALVVHCIKPPKGGYRDYKAEILNGQARGYLAPIPFGHNEQDLDSCYKGVMYRKNGTGPIHILGTDGLGRDVVARLMFGARISLIIGFVSTGIAVMIGIIVGALAGFYGGIVDIVLSRIIEIVIMIPRLFLILIIIAMLRPNIFLIMIVIGITGWTGVARLIRGEFLKQREMDYTTSARALGVGKLRIMFRHIMPNAISPITVAAPFSIAAAIVVEAALSFLGFGVPPPTPSWGRLLQEGQTNMTAGLWWLLVFPGLFIFISVCAYNLIGAGLRDAIDPKLRIG
jgi:peptide/nickel transport system permease protein